MSQTYSILAAFSMSDMEQLRYAEFREKGAKDKAPRKRKSMARQAAQIGGAALLGAGALRYGGAAVGARRAAAKATKGLATGNYLRRTILASDGARGVATKDIGRVLGAPSALLGTVNRNRGKTAGLAALGVAGGYGGYRYNEGRKKRLASAAAADAAYRKTFRGRVQTGRELAGSYAGAARTRAQGAYTSARNRFRSSQTAASS